MRRVIVALVVATLAARIVWYEFATAPSGFHIDFSLNWFGAKSLLHHQNPYLLVGPNLPFRWRFPNLYPATASVAILPLGLLSEQLADILFVWISTVLLVYAMTAKSWHLLPILPSIAFVLNVMLAQWTILTTAMMFLPAAAFFAVAKPQAAFPVIVTGSLRHWYLASLGGILFLGMSFVLLPSWLSDWLALVPHNYGEIKSPILTPPGFLVACVLFKWRRSEAWFVFLLACMPQSWSFFNVLPLLALAATYRDACLLSVVSTIGGLVATVLGQVLAGTPNELILVYRVSIVVFCYLPVVLVILKRPNEGGLQGLAAATSGRLGRRRIIIRQGA